MFAQNHTHRAAEAVCLSRLLSYLSLQLGEMGFIFIVQ